MSTKANKNKRAHGKGKNLKQEKVGVPQVYVGQDGKLTLNKATRPTTKSGPVEKVKPKAVANSVVKASRVAKKQPTDQSIYLVGTAPAKFEAFDSLRNIIAYAQNWVRVLDVHFPHFFRHQSGQLQDRVLYPVDFVAYIVAAIIGGYNRAGGLRLAGGPAAALTHFPEDAPIPIAVAEYIRRIHLVGSPEMLKILTLSINPKITAGEITVPASNDFNTLNYNCNSAGSLLGVGEVWQYCPALAAFPVMDPNDLSTYSYTPVATSLYGTGSSDGWYSGGRMSFVVDALSSLQIGKIPFKDVPMHTTDCSSFGGSNNGSAWAGAQLIWFPRSGGNASVCMATNPIPIDAWFPGGTFSEQVGSATWAVNGGTYGVNFPASVPWVGQPVVPSSLTPVAQATQFWFNILLFAPSLQPRVFGKHGYKFCGQVVHSYSRIVSAPVDYCALVQKLVRAHMNALIGNRETELYSYGYIQGLYLMYGAMLFRKILNNMPEHFASLSGSVIGNGWNIQSLIPTQDYLQESKVPMFVSGILDQIAPVSCNGVIRVPSIGAGYVADNWNNAAAASGAKFLKLPKWVGFADATATPGLSYANGLILNPTQTNVGDPKTWTFPNIFAASGDPANAATENTGFVFGVQTAYTIFPSRGVYYSGVYSTGGSNSMLLNSLSITGPVYNAGSLYVQPTNSWAAGGDVVGKIARMGWQWVGAGDAVRSQFKIISKQSNYSADKMVALNSRGIVGGPTMLANVQYIPSYSVRKPYDVAYFAELAADGSPGNDPVQLGTFMNYHNTALVQTICFLNQARLHGAFLVSATTYPISSGSTPTGLGKYSAAGYIADMQDVTTDELYDDFATACAQEGSAVNHYLSKHLGRTHTKAAVEMNYAFGPANAGEDTGVANGAMLEHCLSMEGPECTTRFTEHEIRVATREAQISRNSNNITAIFGEIDNQQVHDAFDYSAKQFFGDAWKGIKYVAPKAIKAACEIAPLFL